MGIRFRCHHCEQELNLKEFQAGRRARCPSCSGRFRVPTTSADFSVPLDDQEAELAGTHASGHHASANVSAFNLKPSSSDPDIASSRPASQGVDRAAAMLEGLPEPIKEAPQAVWYVRPPGGGQYGPAEGQVFYTWLNDNRVSPDSLVWRDGWPQWQLAGDVFLETFGANWRVAQDASDAGLPISDDTLDGPLEDASGAIRATPSNDPTALSSIATNRRKKRQTTYGILIGLLFLLALVLIGVLISVLWK